MYCLITGTTSGIGECFAKLYAQKGYNLVIVGRKEDLLKKQKKELEEKYNISIIYIVKDLSKDNSALEVFNKVKEENVDIDILINNAGFGICGNYIDLTYEQQKNLAMVNMIALMQLSYLYAKEMVNKGKGRIINIASIASFQAGPYMAMYYSSKAFVRSFSEALHEELKDKGVIVTAICPGPTLTKFEETANLGKSYMFKKLKTDTPEYVVKKSYKAIMKNKAVYVVGFHNKFLAFGTRFFSLKFNRKIAKKINKGKVKD